MKKIIQTKLSFPHLMGNPCGNEASFCGRASAGSPVKRGMTAEGGRSMVEMLGVLAIIGVISIGAIGGYTYGMNRYRTNEILDGANKRAYTISTQDSLGIPYNLSEYRDDNVTAGGTFGDTNTIQDWDGEFGLTITGVSKDVCENLIRMMGDKSTLRAITKTSDEKTDLASGDCASPTNDLYLVYNKDMAAEDATNSGRSGGGGYCATHPTDCEGHTTADGTPFAVISDKNYDEAKEICGGEENMLTPADLGCDINTGNCSDPAAQGVYGWLYDSDGIMDGSGHAILVSSGYLTHADRNDFYDYALCK